MKIKIVKLQVKKMLSVVLALVMVLSVAMIPLPTVVQAAGVLSVENLKTENMENPEGLERLNPVFSWEIVKGDERGISQESYQIVVKDSGGNITWDSGAENTNQSSGIEYAGSSLGAGERYSWTVIVWDNVGDSAVSAAASFSMGLLSEADWKGAQWIGTANGTPETGGSAETDLKKYSVEADFRIIKDNFGIIFGAKNASNFYMWQINTKEGGVTEDHIWLRPHVWEGGARLIGEYDISSVISLAAASDPDLVHNIKIEVDNGKITTYINEILVTYNTPVGTTQGRSETYISDNTHPERGDVGFRISHDANAQEAIAVSKLVVKDSNDKLVVNEDGFTRNIFTGGALSGNEILFQRTDNGTILAFQHGADVTNRYTVETDVKVGNEAAGLIFGAVDNSHFYMWQLNTFDYGTTYLRPHKWNPGGASLTNINIETTLSKNDAENQLNQMKIDFQQGEIKTYINGTVVSTINDSSFPNIGNIGFRQSKAGTSTLNEIGYFDNMMLKDAGGRILFLDDFSTSNPYEGLEVENGVIKAEKSGKEIFLRDSSYSSDGGIPMARKDFTTENKEIKRAMVYASALGHYELQLNGEKVGEDYMAPGWTEYGKRVQYQSYDVTDMIDANGGENSIGAMIAPGWYTGNISILGNQRYGGKNSFIAALVIEYLDGTFGHVVTDNSWRYTSKGPIVSTDMFDGESYDATREIGGSKYGWAVPTIDIANLGHKGTDFLTAYSAITGTSGGNTIALSAQIGPTVKKIKDVTPIAITELGGKYIVDMGQNFAGIVNMSLTGATGTTATIRYAEMLNDSSGTGDGAEGTIYTQNLRSAKVTDHYTFKSDGKESWEPTFSFHGFRYVEISGVSQPPELSDIKGIALASSMGDTGYFNSSSGMLNQIYKNTVWGQYSNFLSIPTDCPQRDERMGWGADTLVFSQTGLYNMDSTMFYQKWVGDWADGQKASGQAPNVSPNPHSFMGDIVWAAGGVVVPYNIWKTTGDTRTLKDNYTAMKAWMSYNEGQGLILSCGYGDWLEPVDGTSNKQIIGTTFYAHQLLLMIDIANELGHTADADHYSDIYEDVKAEFHNRFVGAEGVVGQGQQSGYVLALATGLAQDETEEAQMVDHLVKAIEINGNLMSVGFVSVNKLMPVLTKYGYGDLAYSLAMETRYPSWGYSVEQGATTIWERWNSYTLENGFGPASMNSFNHYSFGSVVEWYYNGVLGINHDSEKPGFENIKISPTYDVRMDFAEGFYDSIKGKVEVRWERDAENNIDLYVTVPPNSTADINIGNGDEAAITEGGVALSTAIDGIAAVVSSGKITVVSVGSGAYHFNFKWTPQLMSVDLKSAIAAGKEKAELEEDFTLPSINALKAAVEAAEEILNQIGIGTVVSQVTIDNSVVALQDAISGLVGGNNRNYADGNGVIVTASSQVSATVFAAKNLVDGKRKGDGGTTWSSTLDVNNDHEEWIMMDLANEATFNRFLIFPRNDGAPSGYGFPKRFIIETSTDGILWETAVDESQSDYPFVGTTPQRFSTEEITAQYIRFKGISLNPNLADGNSYRMQIAEFEVYNIELVAEPTAIEIAATILAITPPQKDGIELTLPIVPDGFAVEISSVNPTGIIGLDGSIIPPDIDTTVELVLKVTKESDSTTALTGTISVVVLGKTIVTPETTAQDIADGIHAIVAPSKGDVRLTLPAVPSGFTIAVNTTTPAGIIGADGTIAPPDSDADVTVVLCVTRTSDGTTGLTGGIIVTVLGKEVIAPELTAQEVADTIQKILPPAKGAVKLTLPAVPNGFTIAVNTTTPAGIIGADGTIAPPDSDADVTVVLCVTRNSDGTTGLTGGMIVTVLGKEVIAPERTAQEVADTIQKIQAPAKGAVKLTLPAVPSGFALAVHTTTPAGIIGADGTITPPDSDADVTVVLCVTRTSDGTTGLTAGIVVTVPAKDTKEPEKPDPPLPPTEPSEPQKHLVVTVGGRSSSQEGTSTPDVSPNIVGSGEGNDTGTHKAETAEITKALENAVAVAEKVGNNEKIVVNLKNVSVVSSQSLREILERAGGRQAVLRGDNMTSDGKGVEVRVSYPLTASMLEKTGGKGVDLSASSSSSRATSIKALFKKFFSNDIVIVSMGQKGELNEVVTLSVKLPEKMTTDNLVIYSYDSETNKIVALTNASAKVDANGYLSFVTTIGGDFVISDGVLVK